MKLTISLLLLVSILSFCANAQNVKTAPVLSDSEYAAQFRCPESFQTEDSVQKAIQDFLLWAVARHPDWTLQQAMDFRYKLLVLRGCTQTLENIKKNSSSPDSI